MSEPVYLADRRGKSASRSQIIILLRTRWQKVTEFMIPLRINVTEKFLHSALLLSYRVVRPALA